MSAPILLWKQFTLIYLVLITVFFREQPGKVEQNGVQADEATRSRSFSHYVVGLYLTMRIWLFIMFLS